MKKDKKNLIIISIFILVLALPFSNKAYHIDDTAFLYVADQIARDPIRPYSFQLEWLSDTKSGTEIFDTPLVPYYVALISWIFTRSEFVLHTSFIIFHIIAGLSFYFIAKKFIKKPLIATLILLSTTTFLVSSHSVMLDVPMLSLFLLAVVLFIYGVDKDRHSFLFFGSIIAGFAYLAKPNGIILIPLLSLYCFLNKKSKYILYQIIPIIFISLFAVHNYLFEDKILIASYIPFLSGAKQSSLGVLIAFIFSNLSYIGGATIFSLFLVFPFILKKKNYKFLGISILISLLISLILFKISSTFISGKYNLLQISLFFIFVSVSIFFILIVLLENYSNVKLGILNLFKLSKKRYDRNQFFIFVWFVGIFLLNSIISGGAVRYNTLFLPPMILIYFNLLEKYCIKFKINLKKLSIYILILTLLVGLFAAFADFEYAATYRDLTYTKAHIYKTESNVVHFVGGAGFQYYMTDQGYRMLLKDDNSPKQGDYIIKANNAFPRKILPELKDRLELVDTIEYKGTIPIRIQNTDAHAGFYSYPGGFLPFSISRSNVETFEVYFVKR